MSVRAPPGTDLVYHVGAHDHRYLASTVPTERIKDHKHRPDLRQLPAHIRTSASRFSPASLASSRCVLADDPGPLVPRSSALSMIPMA